MLRDARKRAKKKGIALNITEEYIREIMGDKCPVFGVPWAEKDGRHGPKEYSPTLDRIDPARGYVVGNVVVISHRANSIKRDANAADIHRVATWLERGADAKYQGLRRSGRRRGTARVPDGL